MTAPKPGDFLLVPVGGPVGFAIELGQFLDGDKFQTYEHAEVYIGQADAQGKYGYTVSAYPNGQGRQPLSCPPQVVPGSFWSSGLIELTDTQRAGIVAWCTAHEHVQYAALDYLALAAHRFHIPVPDLRRYISSTHEMICSQYVDASYRIGGQYNLFTDGRWEGFVKPEDLAELLESKMTGELAVLRPRR